MELTSTKKKIMMAAILTSGLTLAISQAVSAQSHQQAEHGTKGTAEMPCSQMQMTTEMQKARDKFLSETTPIRKELTQKRAEMRAIMAAGTPDATKASQVAGELFELREKLRAKAQEAGLPLPMLMMGDGEGMPCQEMYYHHSKMM
jgi:zinc resistance-associated protein